MKMRDLSGAPPRAPGVVILNDYAHIEGGGSRVAILSASALAAQGHPVLFFAAVGPVDADLAVSGARVVCLDHPDIFTDRSRLSAALRGLWNRRAAAALGRELAGLDPRGTVVHVHNWTKALSASVVRTALDRGFPVAVTLHDYAASCPAGGFYDYRQQRHCSLEPASLRCITRNCDSRRYGHKLWRTARNLVQRKAGGLPDEVRHVVCVSDLARDLQAPHLPPSARIHRVPNPIDVERGPPVEAHRNRNFVSVGRLAAEKGVLLFAEAARAEGAPAVFAGDGYLRARVRQLCPDAEITGWLGTADVARTLGRARVLVFPSLWQETQGLVVLEAAARGIPAIVSDACAAREWVRDGVDGLLFRSGDLADLRRKMALLHDDEQVARLARNAYDRYWIAPPTPERHATALRDLYGGMLRQAQAAAQCGGEGGGHWWGS